MASDDPPVGDTASAGVTTAGGAVPARFVVAADGLRSPLRALAGLARDPVGSTSPTGPRGPHGGLLGDEDPAPERARGPAVRRGDRFGLRCHFAIAPWSPWVEVHWSDGAEAYVTPVGGTADREAQVGVALLFDRQRLRGRGAGARASDHAAEPPFDALLAHFPHLAARLAGVPRRSVPRGVGPLRQRVRRVARGRLALVGDAAGYVDALTGEGLGLGFQSALALADLLATAAASPASAATLEAWSGVHRRLVRWPFLLTEGLLLATRSPALRHRLIAAFARRESTFRGFLAAMAEHRPPRPGILVGLLTGLLAAGPGEALARSTTTPSSPPCGMRRSQP